MSKPNHPPADELEAEFNRMRRRLRDAHATGRGVNLSAREVQLLGISALAEWWCMDDETGKPASFG